MGWNGNTFRISCKNIGFNANDNFDAIPPNAMISGSKNVTLDKGGAEKRGGTIPMNASVLSGTPDVNGIYQFKTTTGSEILIAGTGAGNIISNPTAASPTTIKSGLAAETFYNFTTYNDDCYITCYSNNSSDTTIPAGVDWTARTLPTGANWDCIEWNGSTFCAIAYNSTIAATSADGISWTQRALPVSGEWRNIGCNGSVFCVIGDSSSIALTSSDGISWDQRTLPASANWQGIAWNGTVFCITATGGSTVAATSTDGTSWTQRTLPASGNWVSVAWNGTVFCAISYNSSVAATSPDGITWTQRALPVSANWIDIEWNGSVFCAIAYNSSIAATSPDGITWTQRALPTSANWQAIGYSTVFCAIAQGSTIAATSSDGITWTQRTLPSSANWTDIAYNDTVLCIVSTTSSTSAATSASATITANVPQKWDGSATLTTDIGIPTACTAALAGLGAGNVNAGAHTYKVTFVTAGETYGSNASNSVTTTAGDGRVDLTNIQVGPTGTTSRKIYRTEAGGSTYKLLTTIADNTTTTYADNIADGSLGATIPSSNSAETLPSDWSSGQFPRQIIIHGYGNSERAWCFATQGKTKTIYITPNNDGASDLDFSQANILTLFLETGDGYGLVGGVEFQDRLIAFGKRKAYVIDDSDPNTDLWGYAEAAWEGGAATHKLIVKTPNDIICMADDGEVYSVTAAQQYGDYKYGSISRPHYIHNWIKDNIDLSQIDKFHAVFDPKLRAVRFFMVRQGQSEVDTCLNYYVDLSIWGPPEDNLSYSSGFNAACSAVVRVAAGNYNVYTGDYSGYIWQLNQDDRHDNNNGYEGTCQLPYWSLEDDGAGSARVNKLFKTGYLYGTSTGDYNLTQTSYVNGSADSNSTTVNLYHSSGKLDKDFDIGLSGKNISLKFSNSTANQSFRISEIGLDWKPLR